MLQEWRDNGAIFGGSGADSQTVEGAPDGNLFTVLGTGKMSICWCRS